MRLPLMAGILIVSLVEPAAAQFNVPVPLPTPPAQVFREDMQMLFHSTRFTGTYDNRVQQLREFANRAKESTRGALALDSAALQFCAAHTGVANEQCRAALHPDSMHRRFGTEEDEEQPLRRVLVRSWIPGLSSSRPHVAEYLRQSGGGAGFDVASKFSANVSDKEAYVLSTIVRGLVGRGIFSADQALVVTRSEDPDVSAREELESAKANALRAVNNGGTLVGRFTIPMYARSGSTAASALGITLGAGVLGPITGSDADRSASGSTTLEGAMAFPIRSLDGSAGVIADLLVSARVGYTHGGRSLEAAGGTRDVTFAQLATGLRQNGAMSVSALVTFANHRINDLVPRLSVNFAATR